MYGIPKVCIFYWGGGALSYLQYLSVASFKKHNPSWQINLFIPSNIQDVSAPWHTGEQSDVYLGKDYLEEAKELCTVIEVGFEELEDRPCHEVHKADITRWRILYEYGGIWSDIDILYTKPIKLLVEFDTAVVYHKDPYIGFLITKPQQKIFKDLYGTAQDVFQRNYNDSYQSLGADLLRKYDDFHALEFTYPETKFVNLPMDIVYPYLPGEDIEEMFFGKQDKTTPETIGLHWYNGSSAAKRYQNGFEKYRNNGSIISRLAAECSQ